ncbi:hypothetical protein N7520_008856 [Penicillium odoratum]|uniref:uncharacterized protein n=1 Tax=Penicillium odoratum TaxID=1167516 RepID=UPI002548DC68|nr:uncharacterized protein N7520_008856 [Penicillium odoratum]KAJ5751939.1 hypothetical protein N7520_008856 [Penicillium odoratum]
MALDDMDDYYRGNAPALACLGKEAVSSRCPERYQVHDEHKMPGKGGGAKHVESMALEWLHGYNET